MTTLISVLILFGISAIAYWRDDKIIYIIAGLSVVTYGGYFVATTSYIGLAIMFFGLYTTARGLLLKH